MKCEACGGDGLIEVGAYRGDENDTTTRECRLCGGAITRDTPLEQLAHAATAAGASVSQVVEVLPRLIESTSGARRIVHATTSARFSMTKNALGFYESDEPVPLPTRDKTAEAREIKFERTMSARNADDEMNKFLRDNFKD